MSTLNRISLSLAGAALVATLAAPGPRALLCEQARELVPQRRGVLIRPTTPPEVISAALRAGAARRPQDAAAACTAAFTHLSPDTPPERDDPGVQATIAAMEDVQTRFPGDATVAAALVRARALDHRSPRRYEALAEAAASGARLELGNAFFPTVRFAALMQAGRRGEALAELHRAAALTRWEDHDGALGEGSERLLAEAGAPRNGFLWTLVFLPVHAEVAEALSSAVRAAALRAVEAAAGMEAAGHVDEGIAVRHDVMRVGALMRAQASTALLELAGMGLTARAARRPGGQAETARRAGAPVAQARYLAWLNAHGRSDEARFAEREFAAVRRGRDITRRGMDGFDAVRAMVRAVGWWVVTERLLGLAWLALLNWGFATLWSRGVRPSLAILPISAYALMWAAAVWGQDAGAVWLIALAVAAPIVLEGAMWIATCRGKRTGDLRPGLLIALPCAMLVVYALLAPAASRAQERYAAYGTAVTHHEGRFFAEVAGAAWPE